jgi:hypothetical protein
MKPWAKAAVQGAACGLMIGLVVLIGGRFGLQLPDRSLRASKGGTGTRCRIRVKSQSFPPHRA